MEIKLFEKKSDKIIMAVLGVVEIAAILFMIFYEKKPLAETLALTILLVFLGIAGIIDLKYKIIPNKLIIAGLIAWVVVSLIRIFVAGNVWTDVLKSSLIGGAIIGGVLLVIALIVKSALGMGDVKMFFVAGLFLGYLNAYFLLLATVILMAVVSIVLLIMKKVDRKSTIPMAPFTALAFIICIFIGM